MKPPSSPFCSWARITASPPARGAASPAPRGPPSAVQDPKGVAKASSSDEGAADTRNAGDISAPSAAGAAGEASRGAETAPYPPATPARPGEARRTGSSSLRGARDQGDAGYEMVMMCSYTRPCASSEYSEMPSMMSWLGLLSAACTHVLPFFSSSLATSASEMTPSPLRSSQPQTCLQERPRELSSIRHLSLILERSAPYLSISTTDTFGELNSTEIRFLTVLKKSL
mmetsp:Transcript_27183/g.68991  ORF Transcript_27183/g.68991 Transcript_27183/m.68991 type:complete len:228 (+) Transcript_27183:1028-1711(+)